MNKQVSAFIEKQKQIQKEIKDKQKFEHIKSLGLIDLEKSKKEYLESDVNDEWANSMGYKHHDEKGRFRIIGKPVILEVTDEEYEEICEVCPPSKIIEENKFEVEITNKVDSIRKMVKFFVILTIIDMICGLIMAIAIASNM